ncbi:sulfite exporter TauE/SafE family protein [Paracoccus sp. p4-l81]|uniref:sulfite exporter TauE/SafE family protein n=1 Tax=unclassified Paracoccus (in: a-proteobacteria) TaxID=2688777 RepID=UPI0035B84B04
MQIFLPIAEVSVNAFVLFGLGGIVGLMSGLFGVGGGFLITPLLFFIGIPPAIAVATGANQVVASSFSGLLAHLKRRSVDMRMGWVLLIGGMVGSVTGIYIFNILRQLGQVELVVQLAYVLFLGVIGLMMLNEGIRALRRSRHALPPTKRHHHNWVHGLPLKMKFRASGLYISALLPLGVGLVVGLMAAIMGVGGGIIMVPAMIYLLGMPTKVVVGTSLFQVTALSAFTTVMHAVSYNTVDIMLAVLLILGGVVGAQLGTILGQRLKAEQLRILMAVLVLSVCFKIALDLVLTPADLFSLTPGVLR